MKVQDRQNGPSGLPEKFAGYAPDFLLESTKTKFGCFLFIDWDGFLIYIWNLNFA